MAVERPARPHPLLSVRAGATPLARAAAGVLAHPRAPVAVLVLGSLLIAGLAATVAVDIGAIALDETLLKQSAVHYGSGLPGTLFHDLTARGTSRLYSLVLAPLFVALPGDSGVRAARAANTLMFCSASIPVYLLALRATPRRWAAAGAALLSVAAPWLILTTSIYGESLTLPLVMWTVWAIERSVRAPSWRRDLAALVLITATMCTRTQFGILFVAYWLCIAAAPLLGAGLDALPVVWRRWARGWPLATALLAVIGLYVLYLAARSRLHHEVEIVFGAYSEIQDRGHVSSDMGIGLLVEAVALALGMGIAPAIAGVAWFARVLRRPSRPEWTLALVCTIVVAVFGLSTIYAQGGYLADRTEERYYFYAVPLLWIGAVAAVAGGLRPSRRALAYAGTAFALLFATVAFVVPLNPETGFLAPVLSSAGHVLPQLIDRSGATGLTSRDLLFAVAAGVTVVLVATLGAGRRRAALLAVVAIPALAQLGWTVYAFAVARGDVDAVPARTLNGSFATQSWIDRALPGRGNAAWLSNQARLDPAAADGLQQGTLFWNDEVTGAIDVPSLGLPGLAVPLSALPLTDTAVDPRTARVVPAAAFAHPIVQVPDSPLLQLAGQPIATSPTGGLQLLVSRRVPRVRWAALGLPVDGYVERGRPVRLVATAARPVLVALTVTASGDDSKLDVRLGAVHKRVGLRASKATVVHVAGCATSGEVLVGRLTGEGGATAPDGRQVAYQISSVRLTSAAPGACPNRPGRSRG